MKKVLLYILCGLLPLAILSCEKKPVDEPKKETLVLSKSEINFTVFGGDSAITVKGKDNAAVEVAVTKTGDWFEAAEAENTLTFRAGICGQDKREGSVTLSAEGYEDAVITVTQDAPAPILWDNPSAYYMNLGGGVKSVSHHDYLMRDASISALEFDKDGRLVSFGVGSGRTATIAYDGSNRISSIETSDKGTLKFIYGSHGQYISTETLFFIELAYNAVVLDYPVWMPLFIKDLSKVELIKGDAVELSYELKITGNEGVCIMDGDEDYPVMTFTLKDNFFATSTYGSGFYATDSTFDVDTATGRLRKIDIADSWGAMAYLFNPDRINSFAKVESSDMPATATYNDNLDVASIDNGSSVDTYAYVYDLHNNWTVRNKGGAEDKTRTLEYWE